VNGDEVETGGHRVWRAALAAGVSGRARRRDPEQRFDPAQVAGHGGDVSRIDVYHFGMIYIDKYRL